MLNKPREVISSVTDPQGRKTVLDLIPDKFPRMYPVGRLDYESEGMILLTNDGELANRISHPKNKVKKVYVVSVYGYPSKETMAKFSSGVELEDGKTAPAKIKLINKGKNSSEMEVEIWEGKKRQIRKMFESLGHPVFKLVRTQIGELKMGTLDEGKYRILKEPEINRIFLEKSQKPIKKVSRSWK
jgi:23S rRNA pseudouridine2605 synthase